MTVIYKPYIIRALRNAIREASRENREIEKIVLTHREAKQLNEETGGNYQWDRPGFILNLFEGVKLEVQ